MQNLKDKAKTVLYVAAIGDSLGALTEFMSLEQIDKLYSCQLDSYIENERFLNMGGILGTVTDDFGSSYYVMKHVINNEGCFTNKIAKDAIIEWSQDQYYFKFSGRTTKKAIEYLKEDVKLAIENGVKTNFIGQATNGAAMKVVPIALLARGDVELARKYAISMSYPTHYNSHAASLTIALKDGVSYSEIFEAGIHAARKTEKELISIGRGTIGPLVSYRIEAAISLCEKIENYSELLQTIDEKIGTNMETWESIAAVYGIIASTKGSLYKTLKVAINVGGDTDSMAALAGAIMAAKEGYQNLPEDWKSFVCEQNPGINIKNMIENYAKLIGG